MQVVVVNNLSSIRLAIACVAVVLAGCATVSTSTSDEYAAKADWPVVYEPGYQAPRPADSHVGHPSANASDSASGTVIAVVQYGSGVVSMTKVAGANAQVREIMRQLGASGPQGAYIVRGYAVNDKGVARAQQTAHWRAESLYYRLAKAGLPKSSMLIETRVVDASQGAAGRQAALIKR